MKKLTGIRNYRTLTALLLVVCIIASGFVSAAQADTVTDPPMQLSALGTDFTYLSDMTWVSESQGWSGKTTRKDLAIDGSALKLGGATYTKGLGTHAASSIVYDLNGAYTRFTAVTGINDPKVADANQTGVKFQVKGDDQLLYDGPNMTRQSGSGDPSRLVPIDVNVTGVKKLELIVAPIIPGANTANHANWAEAKVYTASAGLPQLSDISINGSTVSGFDASKNFYKYELPVSDLSDINSITVPAVSAAAAGGANVSVSQAKSVPGEAYITVDNGTYKATYTIRFSVKDTVFASDLDWTSAVSSHDNKICKKDTTVLNNKFNSSTSYAGAGPIHIGGTINKVYNKGIGAYGNSTVTIPLNGAYKTFYSDVGLDNLVSGSSSITMSFIVKGDGRQLASVTGVSYDDPNWNANHFKVDVTGVNVLELVTEQTGGEVSPIGNAVADWGNPRFTTTAIPDTSSSKLASISLNGTPLDSFSPNKLDYEVKVPKGTTALPEITYTQQDPNATVNATYDPADKSIPNRAAITVTNGASQTVYNINIQYQPEFSGKVHLKADRTKLNPLLDADPYITLSTEFELSDGTILKEGDPRIEKIEYSVATLKTSGDAEVARLINGNQIAPVLNETSGAGMEKAYNGGTARVAVKATLSGGAVAEDDLVITVRPFYIDYSKTITAKMQMQTGNNSITMNFADALQAIKNYDNLTNGIHKVIYLVGWQGHGHDSDFPSWDQVNESLAIPGMSGRDSLIYVMNEAKKYNTTLSLHANVTSTSFGNPLYSLYNAKDLWGRRADGSTTVYGGGGMVCYPLEWNSYLLQQRTDRLLELLPPLVEGHTMHFDAFHFRVPGPQSPTGAEFYKSEYQFSKYGLDVWDEIDAMRNIFWYWRELGLDVTAEASTGYRHDPNGNNEAFIGLQPMAWNFGQSGSAWNMDIPADLYTGGQNGSERFGKSYKIEGNDLNIVESNMLKGVKNFMTIEVPFLFLNCFDRISDDGTTVTFSDGVTSKNPQWIMQGSKYYRNGNDIFIPAVFKGENTKEIMVYTESGYTNKVWDLPDNWIDVTAVDMYKLSVKAPEKISTFSVTDGKITLSLAGSTQAAYVIVPAGADYIGSLRSMIHVSDLVLENDSLTLNAGEIKVLNAKVAPANATDRGIRFTSSNPRVATVSVAGKITALTGGTTVITARTTDGNIVKTCMVTVQGSVQVEAPRASIPAGTYADPQKIRLTCDTPGKIDIYYTLDGSRPVVGLSNYYTENDDSNGLAFSSTPAPIEAYDDMVIKAIAVKDGYVVSDVASYTYKITNKKVSTPIAGIPSGKFTVQQKQCLQVYLSTWTPETKIYYTTDGTEPDQNSALYLATAPIMVGVNTTIKAIAYKNGMQTSDVAAFTYQISPATGSSWTNSVSANYQSGVYKAGQFPLQVTLTPLVADVGTQIRYTTDGSNPGTGSPLYNGQPITVNGNTTIKAACFEARTSNLTISTFKYMVDTTEQVAKPAASLPSGKYEPGTGITLASSTGGATIHYTLNTMAPTGPNERWLQIGNEFNPGKSKFNEKIILDKTTTIRAVAFKDGMQDSEIVTYTYYVNEDDGLSDIEITFTPSSLDLRKGEIKDVVIAVTPAAIAIKNVIISVSDPGVAEVVNNVYNAADGTTKLSIKGKTAGTTTIRAAISDDPSTFSELSVTVAPYTKSYMITQSGMGLDREGRITASVDVGLVEGASEHAGQEAVVFELMDGTMPVSIIALEKDITAMENFKAYFNVTDPSKASYTVKVFVVDQFSNINSVPESLADSIRLN